MTLYDVPAPAKLNLFLHIVGRRADGYHLLQSVFRFIDLCDTLSFEARADGAIERAYELPGVAPEQDLVVRAARALQAATGTKQGARIGLDKRIPQGGGLGGGSSDAATTLIALNRLWGCGLSRRELMALGLPLGADVPVFIFGQSAFAQGVGEDLQAVALPPAAYLVLQPEASVPTAEIFSAPDLTHDSKHVRITDFL
ncbi:4-(cytidine 5'-diphospho)-2-C-methyl-D-erythritol kinase, partial [Bordetella pseudohinzii]|uniref:4-(cytidine 5'-diphospho)-2-C-methyl-D-erythritol kinase n=1 Tax=Bordetella pseudohinzii TaxID=1331258 RepID=UPI00191B3C5A